MAKNYLVNLLGEGERILLATRKHWFILASSIFFESIVILIVFGGTIVASTFAPDQILLIVLIGFVLLLIPLISMIHDILAWSNHQYIITNWRVLQVSGIVNKNVTDSSLEKVNDVKMSQSIFGRVFNYGDVEILTASELGVNLFKRIEDPVHFKTAMLNAKESLERGGSQPKAMPDIPRMISQLDELRKQGVVTEEEFQAKKKELLTKL
jgi:uncharacterized membrane protein YdbT with pleckstrin-like domain